MNNQIKLIRSCEWEEVFLYWYKNEGENTSWIGLAKERGYASWADWRLNGYVRRFACERAKWGFFEISNPSSVVADWCGGPFRTWMERHYDGEKTQRFSELAMRPDISGNESVRSMIENYPKDTIVTALKLSDGRVFVIEGMHRTCALSVMAKEDRPYDGNLIFAIGESDLAELPVAVKIPVNKIE